MRVPDSVKLEDLFKFLEVRTLDTLVAGLKNRSISIADMAKTALREAEFNYWNERWRGNNGAAEKLAWVYVAIGNYARDITGHPMYSASLFFDAYQKFVEVEGLKGARALELRAEHPEIERFIEATSEKGIAIPAGSEY